MSSSSPLSSSYRFALSILLFGRSGWINFLSHQVYTLQTKSCKPGLPHPSHGRRVHRVLMAMMRRSFRKVDLRSDTSCHFNDIWDNGVVPPFPPASVPLSI